MLVFLSYGNSLSNGFTWDDDRQIAMNPDLRAGAPWGALFRSDVWGFSHRGAAAKTNYYRPLQMATYRVVAAAWGLRAETFHALSVGMAGVSAVLALMLFWKLSARVDVAVGAAALFAVHPAHTEAVDWASALPDVGCTVFVLASFLLFLEVYGPKSKDKRVDARAAALWAASLACFAAALLWKEMAVVMPALVAAYVIVASQDIWRGAAKKAVQFSAPFWMVLGGYLILRWLDLGFVAIEQQRWTLTPVQVGLSAANLLAAYWWKLIAPLRLNAYHMFYPVSSVFEIRAIAGIAVVAIGCGFIFYFARRRPLLAFCTMWVFASLVPVMDIYALGRNAFAERYLYLPSVGFCLLVALGVMEGAQRLPEKFRKPAVIAVLGAIVLACALRTAARNPDWKDNATLFAKTLEQSPDAPFVLNMVADSESDDESRVAKAEGHFWKAATLAATEKPPDGLQMARAYEGLAWIASEERDLGGALELLARVRRAYPENPEVDGQEGLILTKAGQWAEATKYLQKAVTESHADENVLNALGLVAQRGRNDLDEAAGYFQRALAVHPSEDNFSASVHNNLGSVYGEQGKYAEAIEEFRAAVTIAPGDAEYHTNLATALAAAGRSGEAEREIRAALMVKPGYGPALALMRELGER
ncbi:MAG TPA: tetratricopeptide repeat protein [Candidatus Limnocylindrales bacterium]|nr:tetratricopeptide repeat protein [Candidatus Limnocylindrales bacterium]